ncbi:MAG: HEAT repeat domain-containing protein [Planctomycetota bacterium]|jgi:hypothetical protein
MDGATGATPARKKPEPQAPEKPEPETPEPEKPAGKAVIEANVLKREVEKGDDGKQYIILTLEVGFGKQRAACEVVFFTSKSRFGGTRVEICSPSDKLALRIQPVEPGGEGVFEVMLMNSEGRGFAGKFTPDAPLEDFKYELPKAGETLSALPGKRLILAAARQKEKGAKGEFFVVFIETQTVDELIAQYSTLQPAQKLQTLDKIMKIGDAATVKQLFGLLAEEPDAHLRTLLITAAEAVGNEAAVALAIEYLEMERETEPRTKIYNLLGNFPTEIGFKILKATVVNKNWNMQERIYSALSLGNYDSAEAQDLLIKIMTDETQAYELRAQCATALSQLASEKLLAKLEAVQKMAEKPSEIVDGLVIYVKKKLAGEIEEHDHEEEEGPRKEPKDMEEKPNSK